MFGQIKKFLFKSGVLTTKKSCSLTIEEKNFFIVKKLLSEKPTSWIVKDWRSYIHIRTGIQIEVGEYISLLKYPIDVHFSIKQSKEISKYCDEIKNYFDNTKQYFLNDFLEDRLIYSIHVDNDVFQENIKEISVWLLDEAIGKTFLVDDFRTIWFELKEDMVAFKLIWE